MLHIEMFVVICSAFASVVAWALLSQLRRTSRYDLKRIPGPRTVPLVGNLGAVIGSSYVHKVRICFTQQVPIAQLSRTVQNLSDTSGRQCRVDPASLGHQLGPVSRKIAPFDEFFELDVLWATSSEVDVEQETGRTRTLHVGAGKVDQ